MIFQGNCQSLGKTFPDLMRIQGKLTRLLLKLFFLRGKIGLSQFQMRPYIDLKQKQNIFPKLRIENTFLILRLKTAHAEFDIVHDVEAVVHFL